MSEKRSINDILHSADDKIIDHIASEYRSVDEKTSRRMYERCVKKLELSNNYNDTFYAGTISTGPARKWGVFKVSGITALCAAILGITVYGLSGLRPTGPAPDQEPPVFFTETSVTVTATTETGTDVTTSINKKASADGNNKETVIGSAAGGNGLSGSAVTTTKTEAADSSADSSDKNNENTGTDENNTSGGQTEVRKRTDIDQIADEAAKCRSYSELAGVVRNAFGRADNTSADGAVLEYWFNDEGTDKLTVNDTAQTVLRDNGRRRYYLIGAPNAPDYDKAELKTRLINRGIIFPDENTLLSNVPENCNGTYGYEFFEGWNMENLEDYGYLYDPLMIDSQSDLDLLYEYSGRRSPKAEKIFSGSIPASSRRITFNEAKELMSKCGTIDEVIRECAKLQAYPDFAWQDNETGYSEIVYDLDFSSSDLSADLRDKTHCVQLIIYLSGSGEGNFNTWTYIVGNNARHTINKNYDRRTNLENFDRIAQAMSDVTDGIIRY